MLRYVNFTQCISYQCRPTISVCFVFPEYYSIKYSQNFSWPFALDVLLWGKSHHVHSLFNWMNARVCNVVCCICSNRCCHSSRRNQVIQRFIRYCRPVLKFSIHRVLSCLVLWVILSQFRPNMYLRFSLTVQWRRQKLKFGGLVPQRDPGTEPLVGAMKAKPPKTGGWGGAPRSWAVFSYVGVQLLRFF